VNGQDPLVSGQLLVGGEEVGRSRLRCRGRLPTGAEPLVERLRSELDVVAEALVAKADVERNDPPVREALGRVGEVGRRVDDDRGVLGVEVQCPVQ